MTLPRTDGAPVSVIAHRGASRVRPENTFEAFDEALRQGCDAIELDLQLTRDGVVVVYHDRTLVRAGAGRRRVSRLDSAELTAAAAGIPVLWKTLRRYGRRTHLLLEIKIREGPQGTERHLELAQRTVDLVQRAGLENRTAVLCFDERILDEAARLAPRVPRVLNCRPGARLGRRLAQRLRSLAALSVDVRTLTPGFGAAVRRAGCPLLVFTCNTPHAAERALRASATGIMTDRPDWLRGWVSRRSDA